MRRTPVADHANSIEAETNATGLKNAINLIRVNWPSHLAPQAFGFYQRMEKHLSNIGDHPIVQKSATSASFNIRGVRGGGVARTDFDSFILHILGLEIQGLMQALLVSLLHPSIPRSSFIPFLLLLLSDIHVVIRIISKREPHAEKESDHDPCAERPGDARR